jgi:hypothetical protein
MDDIMGKVGPNNEIKHEPKCRLKGPQCGLHVWRAFIWKAGELLEQIRKCKQAVKEALNTECSRFK